MQLFIDLDGVLADFDKHHKNIFGYSPNKNGEDNVNWDGITDYKNWYLDIPPMEDMYELWEFVEDLNPIILTGLPHSIEEAEDNKREWVKKYISHSTKVICCASKEKCKYCDGGDILIDDREEYKPLWTKAGGIWITHTSAINSIEEMMLLGIKRRSYK